MDVEKESLKNGREPIKYAHRKKILVVTLLCVTVLAGLFVRLVYLMIFRAEHYAGLATPISTGIVSLLEATKKLLKFLLALRCMTKPTLMTPMK